ncbi:MAG: TAT-variant-translocated molybdopterin oxidoreductase, partial [Opitutales bacterium]
MSPISHSTAKADAIREDEFPPGASEWPESLSRRRFLEVSAALSAMLSLGGCLKPPREAILPYVRQPENSLPGLSRYFATTYAFQGFARGVLAESHQGRPTKLEGNPLHPESLGATDARMQAAVLDLYNPDRLRSPRQSGNITTWQTFASELWPRLQRHKRDRGRGMALVLPATTSPTLERLLGRVRKRFPDALVVSETPSDLPDLEPFDYDFTAADIVLGVAPDFLTQHPSSLRYARAFAQRRRGWDKDTRMNRFFALQSAPSLEGSMADLAMTQSPQQRVRLLEGIAAVMEGQGISGLG